MSAKDVEAILSRAMSEPAFADLLFSDVNRALVDFDLTATEAAKFKAMSRTDFDKLAKLSPEERKSLGGLGVFKRGT